MNYLEDKMGQDNQMSFAKTFEGKDSNGLPEWKAQFVKGDSAVAGAFKSAAARGELKSNGGFAVMNLHQIEQRIDQLKAAGGFDSTIAQLELGRHAIEERTKAPQHAATGHAGAKLQVRVL
jgi:hypothetical protein